MAFAAFAAAAAALSCDVQIEMRQFRHDEDFTREEVDFWIEVKRPQRAWPDHVQTQHLLGKELVPVCAPSLKRQFRKPQDLQRATLLGHTNFPDNWARWFEAAGVPFTPKPAPSFDLTNLIVATKSGMGVAVVPACLVECELAKGELVKPFELEVSCARALRHRSPCKAPHEKVCRRAGDGRRVNLGFSGPDFVPPTKRP